MNGNWTLDSNKILDILLDVIMILLPHEETALFLDCVVKALQRKHQGRKADHSQKGTCAGGKKKKPSIAPVAMNDQNLGTHRSRVSVSL